MLQQVREHRGAGQMIWTCTQKQQGWMKSPAHSGRDFLVPETKRAFRRGSPSTVRVGQGKAHCTAQGTPDWRHPVHTLHTSSTRSSTLYHYHLLLLLLVLQSPHFLTPSRPQELVSAHRSRLTAFDCSAGLVVTGSAVGGVKVWDLAALKQRAAAKGMAFPPAPRTSLGHHASFDLQQQVSINVLYKKATIRSVSQHCSMRDSQSTPQGVSLSFFFMSDLHCGRSMRLRG